MSLTLIKSTSFIQDSALSSLGMVTSGACTGTFTGWTTDNIDIDFRQYGVKRLEDFSGVKKAGSIYYSESPNVSIAEGKVMIASIRFNTAVSPAVYAERHILWLEQRAAGIGGVRSIAKLFYYNVNGVPKIFLGNCINHNDCADESEAKDITSYFTSGATIELKMVYTVSSKKVYYFINGFYIDQGRNSLTTFLTTDAQVMYAKDEKLLAAPYSAGSPWYISALSIYHSNELDSNSMSVSESLSISDSTPSVNQNDFSRPSNVLSNRIKFQTSQYQSRRLES